MLHTSTDSRRITRSRQAGVQGKVVVRRRWGRLNETVGKVGRVCRHTAQVATNSGQVN